MSNLEAQLGLELFDRGHRKPVLTEAGRAVLDDHTQLVLTDRSRLTDGQEFGVLSVRTWRLGDLGAKHALLRAGLGWGNMPEHMVRDDLRDGRLVQLRASDQPVYPFALHLIHRADTPPGPAGSWLAERLLETSTD